MNSYYMILDSGAVALYNRHVKKSTQGAAGVHIKDRRTEDYSFYKSKEFKKYRRAYLKYVLKNKAQWSGCINLDIINNAEESYKSLKWFAKRGADLIPVYHFGSPLSYLQQYIDDGYKFIAIGGVTPNRWEVVEQPLIDIWKKYFEGTDIKVHGLACTSFNLITNFPWYSVDSTSWRKSAAYGKIYVPYLKKDKSFNFNRAPFVLGTSMDSLTQEKKEAHANTLTEKGHKEKAFLKWMEYIKIPLGSVITTKTPSEKPSLLPTFDKTHEMDEWGLLSHHNARGEANMEYFSELVASSSTKNMLFAGSATLDSLPEERLKKSSDGCMFTYWDFYTKNSVTRRRVKKLKKRKKRCVALR